MRFEPFAMERMQSLHEHRVGINLSESGVHPLALGELLDLAGEGSRVHLENQRLVYTQTNGTEPLREAVAAFHRGAAAAHVQMTNGGSEANFLVCTHLVQPADEVVLMMPNYMQAWGIVRALGADVREWWLVERQGGDASGWRPDLDRLQDLVGPRTRLIVICTPNNPTGSRLTAAELDAVCAVADRHGAWVLSDEIYRGAERDGRESPTAWGRGERVIVTGGLSKAYGLPGLRIGWLVASPEVAEATWGVHDYTTIAPGALSDHLARVALRRDVRERLLARTQQIVRENYVEVERFVGAMGDVVHHVAPDGGAVAWIGYRAPIDSSALAERLRLERDTMVVPGDQFRAGSFLRVGFGGEREPLRRGLDRVAAMLKEAAGTGRA